MERITLFSGLVEGDQSLPTEYKRKIWKIDGQLTANDGRIITILQTYRAIRLIITTQLHPPPLQEVNNDRSLTNLSNLIMLLNVTFLFKVTFKARAFISVRVSILPLSPQPA